MHFSSSHGSPTVSTSAIVIDSGNTEDRRSGKEEAADLHIDEDVTVENDLYSMNAMEELEKLGEQSSEPEEDEDERKKSIMAPVLPKEESSSSPTLNTSLDKINTHKQTHIKIKTPVKKDFEGEKDEDCSFSGKGISSSTPNRRKSTPWGRQRPSSMIVSPAEHDAASLAWQEEPNTKSCMEHLSHRQGESLFSGQFESLYIYIKPDPPENCQLNVKKIAKNLTFKKKNAKKFFEKNVKVLTIFLQSNGNFPEGQIFTLNAFYF